MEQEWTIEMEYEGAPCGEAHIRRDGLYMVVGCVCAAVTGQVVRAWLPAGEEPFCLGVLEPEDGRLRLTRRFPASRFPAPPYAAITVSQNGELWSPWSGEIAGVPIEGGLSRTRGNARTVALPWPENGPFAWMALALDGVPGKIGGKRYLTYTLG